MTFGSSHHGLSTKTGPNQSLIIEDGLVARILAKLKAGSNPASKVFPMDQNFFRGRWNKTQDDLEFACGTRPVHTLRHSRPSYLVHSGKRTLEEIRRRGRWRQQKSVQRYSKDAHVVLHKSQLNQKLQTRGAKLILSRNQLLTEAVSLGKASRSELGRVWRESAIPESEWAKASAMEFPSRSDDWQPSQRSRKSAGRHKRR